VSTAADRVTLRDRLYQAYASQHAGCAGSAAAAVVYRRDIRPWHVSAGHLSQEADRVPLTADALNLADAVVLLTDHDDVDCKLVQREARWILDCRNRLSGTNVELL
jgi:UDP-N-acetyl-D-mannosaminuronate dehydrogenase